MTASIHKYELSLRWMHIVSVFDHKQKQELKLLTGPFQLKRDASADYHLYNWFHLNVPMSLLLQLELEQQKNEEEQENTPEFVKMKSNLRRTKQEADGEERTT